MFDFLFYNPVRHRVYIVADHIATDSIGFYQGRAPAHEGICNEQAVELIRVVESFSQWPFGKFGKKKRPKKCPRAAGKPFMYRNNRSIVLLDLLFPKCQIGNKGNVKGSFDQFVDPYLLGEIVVR